MRAWWARYAATHLARKAETTQGVERAIARPLLSLLGDRRLEDITKTDLVAYLAGRRVRPATLRNEIQKLHTLFQQAVEEGLLHTNPLRRIPRPAKVHRTRVLSPAEQRAVSAVLSDEDARWLLFMLGTGLRVGDKIELVGPASLTVWGKGKRRTVPLLAGVAAYLPPHPDRTPRQWRDRLKEACRQANVQVFTPHVLRHTFATRYLAGGGDIYILSRILGHASVTVTEQVYAHLLAPDLAARSAGIDLGLVAVDVATA